MSDSQIISDSGLSLSISVSPEAIVMQCCGNLLSQNSDFLKNEVKSRIPAKGCLILDLSDVTRMDSSGLGTLVGLYLSSRSKGCELRLINLNKQIRDLLALSNLLSVFDTYGRQGIRMP